MAQIEVGESATQLDLSTSDNRCVLARNQGSVTVYLGPEAVTAANGFALGPGDAISWDATSRACLYAVTASDVSTVHVLQIG